MLHKNSTIDWQKKESARAGMRRMVKKLLKKYNYPPEGLEDALATVIGQCEMWTDNENDFPEGLTSSGLPYHDSLMQSDDELPMVAEDIVGGYER